MEIIFFLLAIVVIFVTVIVVGKSKGAPDPEYMQDNALVARLKNEESWLSNYKNLPYENQQSKSLKKMHEEKTAYIQLINNEIIKRQKSFETNQDKQLKEASMLQDEPDLIITEKAIQEAENGDNRVQFLVGSSYLSGSGGLQQDVKKAHYYIRKAAEKGHPLASLVLAGLYTEGAGVNQDLVEANMWALKAQALGQPEAGDMLLTIDAMKKSNN